MAITMPKIDITFEQRAVSLIGRSERGVAILIVRDDTDKTFTHKQYSDLSAAQADESLYTADNYAAICDLLALRRIRRMCSAVTRTALWRIHSPRSASASRPAG